MNIFSRITFVVLLLAVGVLGQIDPQKTTPNQNMPGLQGSSQPGPQQNQRPLPEAPKPAESQQKAMPAHEHGREQMETHNPKDSTSNVSGAQEPENPNRRTGGNLPVPDLLESATVTPAKSLEEFEALALEKNPTVREAEAVVEMSEGLARQVGLWPNPSIGYQGEEIRGGDFRGGEQGAFVQQSIILGGKLRLRRNAIEEQRKADQIGVEEQKLSLRGAVQVQFYSALARLRIVEIQRTLLGIATDAATTAHQLANIGQADAPDVLQAEVEAEQAKLGFVRAQRDYIQAYRQLIAIVGDPQMPLALLKGNLENPPAIDSDGYVQNLLANSPSLKRAQQEANLAKAALARDRREAVPDLTLRAGAQQNLEIDEITRRPVGGQGFASASIQLPIFNRNQGNIQASRARVEGAHWEVERVRLQLIQAAQPLLQQYAIEKLDAERYRTQLIPRARRAYELYLNKYNSMAAAYPEVIISQRTLFQLEDSYSRTLGQLWTTALQLQNYLLADALSAPRPTGSASTQINLPANGDRGTE